MPEFLSKVSEPAATGVADKAIADIVDMNPHQVEVRLSFPVSNSGAKAVVTLKWMREDQNMPLTELLQKIEMYVATYGSA